MYCPHCGFEQPVTHRFCIACGIRIPSELFPAHGPKVTRLFRSVPVSEADDPEAVLRATRYVEEFEMKTAEGSVVVPNHHVRLSIWHGDRPACVISIPDDEAEALSRFLAVIIRDGSTAASL